MLSDFFVWLNKAHGLNFSVFYDAFEWNAFVDGVQLTIMLSIASIVGSVFLGLVGAAMLSSKSRLWRGSAIAYVWVFRNTPPLIQMYFFYFALGPTITNALGFAFPIIGNTGWAIISLTLFATAFNIEIFRAGIDAVPQAMTEAARAMGLNRRQIFTKVSMPLAWRISLPALNNNLINLIKTTANASAIAVPELLYSASQIWAQDLNTTEMMFVVLIVYLIMIGIFVFMMNKLERKLAVPGWGTT